MKHLSDEQLVAHYYGELDDPLEATKHLEICDSCQTRFAALGRDLSFLKEAVVPDRPMDYGHQVWRRLEPRLKATPAQILPGRFVFHQWKLAVAAALLVVTGFVAGRFGPGRETQQPEPVSEAARDRILLTTVADHLDQSQLALLELVNSSDSSGIISEQERTSELVAANRLYRQSATQAGEVSLASVLDELERVLIEIANQPADATGTEMREIRRRIVDEDLLFKIRVLSSQVRSREKKGSSQSLL